MLMKIFEKFDAHMQTSKSVKCKTQIKESNDVGNQSAMLFGSIFLHYDNTRTHNDMLLLIPTVNTFTYMVDSFTALHTLSTSENVLAHH